MTDITTAIPDLQITENGVERPELLEIINGSLADINAALGGGMQLDIRTPQGQLATSISAIVAQAQDRIATLINQLDPDYSSGRFQDGIGKIYFLNRSAGKGTVVSVICTGLNGTVIPSGSVIQDTNGNKYSSLFAATIPESGSVNIDFQNIVNGTIGCPINAINTIITPITGWSDVQNTTTGVLGELVESARDFEQRRKQSVALNARSVVDAIQAKVAAVNGVVDYYVIDNFTDEAITKGATNTPIKPHSTYVCVSGGNSDEIAKAIWLSKSAGSDLNGNVNVTVTDDTYEAPKPQYQISYQSAIPTPIYIKVNIANNPNLPADITTQIQNAIIDAFKGKKGGQRARIGSLIYASRFYCPVYSLDTESMSILSITISKDNTTFSADVEMGIDQIPTIDATNIEVTLT